MAVGVAGHHQAEADSLSGYRERGERGPSFEARAGGIGKDRQEMIESPGGVVAQTVDLLPEGEQFGPRGVLLRRLDSESGGKGCHAWTSASD